jgi:hypothetical protein
MRWLLLTLCLARLWIMPLPSSFWTDETGTAFVVERPADPSLLAPARLLYSSIYYTAPRVAQKLFGFSEISYRLPSILFMGIALWLIARIAARLIHPEAAWFAVFACLALPSLNYYAADARPYALGICLAAASIYCLIEWLDSSTWIFAGLFVVCAALLWRVHRFLGILSRVFYLCAGAARTLAPGVAGFTCTRAGADAGGSRRDPTAARCKHPCGGSGPEYPSLPAEPFVGAGPDLRRQCPAADQNSPMAH